ncbi:FtsX-like permease family protein [Flammeovirga yaeyamensis]|uniref:FtsX-like permease family protein n=1 Tax=Flammeovirga yaeyamensis TaxID=367791 RepID=A0AAX1N172_9BACT|nr:FtsX-like permease family protein [Flammeovirga yaeyamensis]MBB3698422.1 ABC-type lipoprotein release transport system permease subunit [Flammeovirga yaeyamensis]NMF34228.1 ABC transporter permease [Flammeovirga yaeyamensis]QWG01212.1 FtsX-like permease family protein [Flammeovirga yaeyamensis]
MMITKISWRNVWRNKLRSGILIASIAIGLLGGIFTMAAINGMMESKVEETLVTELANAQIHKKGFEVTNNFSDSIPQFKAILNKLDSDSILKINSPRVVINGMGSSANDSQGLKIIGIDPDKERKVTDIEKFFKEGDYFEGKRKNQIVIGASLAKKLKVKIRSKIVIAYMGPNKEMINTAYRVVGIFSTSSPEFDKSVAFVRNKDIWRNTGEEFIHEIAFASEDGGTFPEKITKRIQSTINEDGLNVQTWKQIAPELATIAESGNTQSYIILGIILFALGFGILNSMTMAIFERSRELGVLMAVGLNRSKVFLMIVLETIYLSMIGAAIGGVLVTVLINYFGEHGLKYAESSMGGFSNILYPNLPLESFIPLFFMVLLTAIVSALPPAFRAIRLNPAEAVRYKG